MTKRSFFLTLALAASFALPGLAARAEEGVITLGASLQSTGVQANSGRYYVDGYQLAVDAINAKGGVTVGGKAYKLALKLYDNKSEPALATRQYEELITSDKVDFLLGPFASNFVIDTSAIAEKYRVPMVQGGGASGQIYSRGFKYVFGTLPPAEDYYLSTIGMLTRLDPKPSTVALVAADDAFDVSVATGTRSRLKNAGFNLVADETFVDNKGEFSAILDRIKSRAPDVILWSGHDADALIFVREMKSRDVSAKLTALVGVPAAGFRGTLKADADYAFGMTTWLPEEALTDAWFGNAAEFAKAYKAKFGYAADYHAAAAAAAVETYAVALAAARSLDAGKVRGAIAAAKFDSLYAHVEYGANGQVLLPQVVVQIQNGEVVPIYTTDFQNKPIYPVPAWNDRK